MIKSSCPQFFLVAIISLILLLITIVNGNNNNNQMEKNLFEKRLTSTDRFNDLLEPANINKENIDIFIRDLQKPYPDRRSSFHALRGKRRVI